MKFKTKSSDTSAPTSYSVPTQNTISQPSQHLHIPRELRNAHVKTPYAPRQKYRPKNRNKAPIVSSIPSIRHDYSQSTALRALR